MTLDARQLADYRRDGFLIVPGVYPTGSMDAACAAMERIFYGSSFEQWLRRFDAGRVDRAVADGIAAFPDPSLGRSQWPVGDDVLDRLIENDGLLDACEQLLGDQPLLCGANLFLRCGPTDQRHSAAPHQGWHFDSYNNTTLPPSDDPGRFSHLIVGVYLHDVDESCAPMMVIPGTHHRAGTIEARELDRGNIAGGSVQDLRLLGDLPAPVPACGARGSVVFMSSFALHAAQPFRQRRQQRAVWSMVVCRRDNATWMRSVNPFGNDADDRALSFLEKTTPRVRTLLGWPEPGNVYYTERTLALLAQHYPQMDLAAYRSAAIAN